ncbi:Tic20 family protein [Synechococcus elongatus]|uniref:Tic20 family protein n=1 Tax=Synechococcus elongatus PCC 11802 TaxID=2283154 RepID=A0AAT9JYY4_SYNEL|nr:Tic20 family protein [Synechococcus elongatus]QFZ91339.1 hypothetical protein EKO22_02105 [Synechococcus elongatus PCC 11802]
MTWRGSASPADRFFACLPYLLPLAEGVSFGFALFNQFPVLQYLILPLVPVLQLFQIPFAGLIIFFLLFFLVVRNEKINHFIRFNAMQAILIDILLILANIIFQMVLRPTLGGGFILETLNNTVFLAMLVGCLYSIIQSILGRYAEIPTISDAVYMQVR